MIGIKIASGEFYPILQEGSGSSKRLVLTTVKDGQRTVHIDLYRSQESKIDGAEYVGSLIIENIKPRAKGAPDIELALDLDSAGSLTATAIDRESGESRSLSVSVGPEGAPDIYSIPDFELSAPGPIQEYGYSESINTTIGEGTEEGETVEKKNGVPPWAIVIIVLLALLILLGAALLVFCGLSKDGFDLKLPFFGKKPVATLAPTEAPTIAPTEAPALEPSPLVAEATLSPEPTIEITPEPTIEATPTPTKAPVGKNGSKGVNHKIRWGDTLWDISIRYYGTPWLYKKIAKANKIRNPDLIISGRKLWIPPR